jgi:hypothetical protein
VKRIKLLALIGAVSLTLLVSLTIESWAAAVGTTTFSNAAKIFEGRAAAPGGKLLATDGSNFYTAFVVKSDANQTSSLRLTRISKDGAVTWASEPLFSRDVGVLDGQLSIAVSSDNSARKQKTIHLVWSQTEKDPTSGTAAGIYYSWSNDAELRKWSTPLRVNNDISNFGAISVVIGKTGAIHIVFRGNGNKIFHTTASTPRAPFTKPVQIAAGAEELSRNVDIALDSGDNLHLAFVAVDGTGKAGVRYTKKLASSSNWSAPLDVVSLTPVSGTGSIGIAADDPNTVYIASTVVNEKTIEIFRSNDGGKSWVVKTLAGKPTRHLSIAVASNRSVTVAVGVLSDKEDSENIAVFRSQDGLTWSAVATIPKVSSANIAIDSNGKVGVLCLGQTGPEDNTSFFAKEL